MSAPMSAAMQEYPALENFLSAYFHQDWAAEHGSPDAVVSYFLDHESDAEIANVRREIKHLAALDLDESALATRFRALGSEYDPVRNGGSYRDWLAALATRFAR